LSQQNLRAANGLDQNNNFMLTRDVSPCLSPVGLTQGPF